MDDHQAPRSPEPSPPVKGAEKPLRRSLGVIVRLLLGVGALVLLYVTFGVGFVLGLLTQSLPARWHPEWGSTLPTPLAQALALLVASPFLLVALRRQRKERGRIGPPLWCCLAGLIVGGAFFGGLRNDVIPARGLAAREALEDVVIRGFRLEDDGFENGVNPYKDFVAEDVSLGDELIEGLPEGFQPAPWMGEHAVWPNSNPFAAWKGPHPWDAEQSCWVTLDRFTRYRDDPPQLRRASVHAFCRRTD